MSRLLRRDSSARLALATAVALMAAVLTAVPASAAEDEPVIVPLSNAGRTSQVAIDGERILLREYQDPAFVMTQHNVSFAGRADDPSPQVLRGAPAMPVCTTSSYGYVGRCSTMVMAAGVSAWATSDSAVGFSTGSEERFPAVGDLTKKNPTAVWGDWVLLDETQLINTSTGETQKLGRSDLYDGVLYLPGYDVPSLKGSVIMRDLTSGAATSVSYQDECNDGVQSVQANGSWLLLSCNGTRGYPYLLVDRTGAIEPRRLPGLQTRYLLGNGFLLENDQDSVSWSPLDVLSWSYIGEAGYDDGAIAVSKGPMPSAVMVGTQGVANALLFPVTPTVAPALGETVAAAPSAPAVTAVTRESRIEVTWQAPRQSDRVTGYVATLTSGVDTVATQVLPSTDRSFTFSRLTNGQTYNATIIAVNAAGLTDTAVTRQIVGDEPGTVSGVRATRNDSTGVVTVTWDWTGREFTDALQSFSVETTDRYRRVYSKTGIPASARTYSFTPERYTGGQPVTVSAVGARGQGTASVVLPVDTAPDTVLPKTTITNLPKYTLGTKATFTVSASDNREVEHLEVGYTVTDSSGRADTNWYVGQPWNNLHGKTTLTQKLYRGSTYCYVVRAIDTAGLTSKWSKPECTSVAQDDKSLIRSGATKKVSSTSFIGGSALQLRSKKSSVSVDLWSRNVWLVTTTCPTCGDVGIKKGKSVKWISLKSKKTVKGAVVPLRTNTTLGGTYKIVQRSKKGYVTVDAVIFDAR